MPTEIIFMIHPSITRPKLCDDFFNLSRFAHGGHIFAPTEKLSITGMRSYSDKPKSANRSNGVGQQQCNVFARDCPAFEIFSKHKRLNDNIFISIRLAFNVFNKVRAFEKAFLECTFGCFHQLGKQ